MHTLLIDDDPVRRNMLASALRLRGGRVTTFVTGYGALNRIRELEPDLLFVCAYETSGKVPAVDWLLPRIDSRIIVATLDQADFGPITTARDIPVMDSMVLAATYIRETAVDTDDMPFHRSALHGTFQLGELCIDPQRRDVHSAGVQVRLRRDDYAVLELLLQQGSEEVTQDEIGSTMQGMFGKGHYRSPVSRVRALNSLGRPRTKVGVRFQLTRTGGIRAIVPGAALMSSHLAASI